MDARKAVNIAKDYILTLFHDEGVFNIGLEEVEFSDSAQVWEITVGFSRPWDRTQQSVFSIAAGQKDEHRDIKRTYKVVEISDADEGVLAVRNRTDLS